MKQFKKINMQKETLKLIEETKIILEDYQMQGIKITLRGLYYQLVAKNLISNNLKTYGKLSRTLTNARYTGLIGWDLIVDNSNFLDICNFFNDIDDLLNAAINSYKLDRWEDQEYYIEVWIEKDALRGIIQPITNQYQINLFIPGGRVSTTMIYEASIRFSEKEKQGKKCVLLYLGDHDPCGLDMVIRDIPKRMEVFRNNVNIIPIALTKEQIQKHNIPTDQLTKEKDKTKKWYIELTDTDKCWELDALSPEILQSILEENILNFLDICKFEKIKSQEEEDKNKLKEQLK